MSDTPDGSEDRVVFERPIKPGRPRAENVAFVLLGVLVSIAAILRVGGVL